MLGNFRMPVTGMEAPNRVRGFDMRFSWRSASTLLCAYMYYVRQMLGGQVWPQLANF